MTKRTRRTNGPISAASPEIEATTTQRPTYCYVHGPDAPSRQYDRDTWICATCHEHGINRMLVSPR
jgi:hypothetical protein